MLESNLMMNVTIAKIGFFKATIPFGKAVLEVDGKKIDQSVAVGRYLAKQCGLAGKNDWESLEIDATVDTIHELRANIFAYYYFEGTYAGTLHNEQDMQNMMQNKYAKLKTAKETAPYYLERLDAQVKKNGGYFVGGTLTWADLTFVALLRHLNGIMNEDIVEKYENLKQLQKKVEEIPDIENWIENRPPTIYPTWRGVLYR
ncbi:glutathione S-transferase-like isoform X2 [Temnothorax longispinosus]|uniref:glutathione S-transferase-like isoform X2 n=1 Tax=Temnothorax longispinosus TaxID=300112 RepID=UPI003A9A4981